MRTAACVIFDMDGTLADTSQTATPALRHAARGAGLPEPAPEAVRRAIGVGGPDFYRLIFPGAADDLLGRVAETTFAREQELNRELGPRLLFPGIRELLSQIAQAGWTMAIASTGEVPHVRGVLGCAGIIGLFAQIECGCNDKVRLVRNILGARPGGRFALVGDKPKDSGAARANGLPSIGAGYGFSAPEELAGFTHVAASPEGVWRCLASVMRAG